MADYATWEGRRIRCAKYKGSPGKGLMAYELRFEDGGREEVVLTYSEALANDTLVRCGAETRPNSLPEDPEVRNSYPMADGLLDYFPNALAEVSRVSFIGNQQHNPGEPMHWARGKSIDHRNKILRHLIDAGGKDEKGIRHSAYLAWRALANLQEELEREEGYPLARGATPPEEK